MEIEREMEIETNEETVEEGPSAVPKDCLVNKPNAKATVLRYFGMETELGMVKDQKSARMRSLSCMCKYRYQQLVQPFEKASPN